MHESLVPATARPSLRRLALHVMVFALAGPLVGLLGAGLVLMALAIGVNGVGPSWSELARGPELTPLLPLAFLVGGGPAALTGAAVGLARERLPSLTWQVAAAAGLLTPLLLSLVLGYVAPLALVGLFSSLVCTTLTYPLGRRG